MQLRRPLRSWSSLAVWIFAAACNEPTEPIPYPRADEQNIDVWELVAATEVLSQVDGMRGFLVARNGVIVLEEYFGSIEPDSVLDVRSVTKSYTSALVGIAIGQGSIQSTDDTLAQYLVPDVVASLDSAKAAITLHELLTMSAGFEWAQGRTGLDFGHWYVSDDHVQYVLDKPLITEPGTTFAYSDGMAHLVSVILTEATGMNADEFADQYLFAPLGLGPHLWLRGNRGYNFGGVRLHLTLRDMWTFGELYLNGGRRGTTQIVPAEWVQRSTQSYIGTDGHSPFGPAYGYFWWIGEGAPYEFYFANGYGGQFIVVVPDAQLVVVTQCQPNGFTRNEADLHWYTILSTVVGTVLPAAKQTR